MASRWQCEYLTTPPHPRLPLPSTTLFTTNSNTRPPQERQNPGNSEDCNRWADEENSNTRHASTVTGNPSGLRTASAVNPKAWNSASSGGAGTLPRKHNYCLDPEGNIDYLRLMSNKGVGGLPSPAGGISRPQNVSGVLNTYGGGKTGKGLLPFRPELGGSSRLGAAGALAPWKKMLELDEQERKQVRLLRLLCLRPLLFRCCYCCFLASMPFDVARGEPTLPPARRPR